MSYAIIGIPLALLYLAQCSKMFAGLFPGNHILIAALVTVFATAVIFDIIEESNDDTVHLNFLNFKCNEIFVRIFNLLNLIDKNIHKLYVS